MKSIKRVTVDFPLERFAAFCDHKTPVQALVEAVGQCVHKDNIRVISRSLDGCTFLWDDPSVGEKDAFDFIGGIVKELFGDLPYSALRIFVDVEDENGNPVFDPYSEEDLETEIDFGLEDDFDLFNELEKSPEPQEELPTVSGIDSIRSRVESSSFVGMAEECVRVAPLLKKNGLTDVFARRSYLFAINDTQALEEYLRYYWALVKELDLFPKFKSLMVNYKLRMKRQDFNPLEDLQKELSGRKGAAFYLLNLDISEWMSDTKDPFFREILQMIAGARQNFVLSFRIPYVEQEVFSTVCADLSDTFTLKAMAIPPMSMDDLLLRTRRELENFGYDINDTAANVIKARYVQEKSDGRFHGISTIKKVADEVLYQKQLHNDRHNMDDKQISGEQILSICALDDEDERTGMEMLDEFIGIDAIRQRVLEIVAQIEMSMKHPGIGAPCIHMRFVGNPGTGKTTVARVIGKILSEKGVLRNGNFFEHTGREFCGRYVGETAPKTAGMCRDAYGSVLFIDEAYTLFTERHEKSNDFGREALDTLVTEMENHRNDLLVIMAGYPDEMEHLMRGNSGLESRMPYVIEFPNYTREQLADIYMQLADKHFDYEQELEDEVRAYFDGLSDEVVTSKTFSNARFVRNLFERTWGKAALRCQLDRDDEMMLMVKDFTAACRDSEFKKDEDKKLRHLGFA